MGGQGEVTLFKSNLGCIELPVTLWEGLGAEILRNEAGGSGGSGEKMQWYLTRSYVNVINQDRYIMRFV